MCGVLYLFHLLLFIIIIINNNDNLVVVDDGGWCVFFLLLNYYMVNFEQVVGHHLSRHTMRNVIKNTAFIDAFWNIFC